MNGYNAFVHSTFRFLGVELEDGEVVARITEKDGGCFGESVTYTQGEDRVAGLLRSCQEEIERRRGEGNLAQNEAELERALNAIRSRKSG